jgi:hypothetical protein
MVQMKVIIDYVLMARALVSSCCGLVPSTQKPTPRLFTNSRQLIDQQKVVIRTALVVTSLAIYTKQYPLPFIGSQLRKDMLAGTIIFQVGDWLGQLFTHGKKQQQQQQLSLNKENGTDSGKKNSGRRRKWHKQKIRPLLKDLKTFKVDGSRYVISTILGAFWAGYVNPSIYAFVDNNFPGISLKLVLLKMVITCSILSTWGNYTTMMIRRFLKLTWESGTISKAYPIFCTCLRTCKDDFMGVLADDLKIFPPYDILCYSVIPPQIRPITNALVCSGWQCYMSIASASITTPSLSEKAITV